ncbi:hypothetical protein V6N13_014310 [Hibiscus sabdariffa]
MGKKRKHIETWTAEPRKKDEGAPERPKRTLMGWKDKEEVNKPTESSPDSPQVFRNKEKVMVTCSHRINYRHRHLMLNMVSLLLHCKKDNKCRKHQDLYMWMARCPNGPSVKFLVDTVHTMEELKLTGNHLKGSRPLLTFSSNFEKDAHLKASEGDDHTD